MSVVADTHALVWYLTEPNRLSQRALGALQQAESTDGIVVSVVTFAELWYVTRKTSSPSLSPADAELVKATVVDPATNLHLAPITEAVVAHFGRAPASLRDPFDRLLIATALQLGLPLVSADRMIADADLVRTIW